MQTKAQLTTQYPSHQRKEPHSQAERPEKRKKKFPEGVNKGEVHGKNPAQERSPPFPTKTILKLRGQEEREKGQVTPLL